MISANGMCPVPGVLNYPPTSWELCKCAQTRSTGRCACPKTRTRSCHDMWMVPSESVIEALRDAAGGRRRLRHRVERENWMDPRGSGAAFDASVPRPDHAVTSGHVWLPPASRVARRRRAGTQVIKQPKRLRLATNRKLRSKQTAALCTALGADERITANEMRTMATAGRIDDMDRAFVNATREATTAAMRVKLAVDGEDSEPPEGPLSRSQLDKLRRAHKGRPAVVERMLRGEVRTEADKELHKRTGRILALLHA